MCRTIHRLSVAAVAGMLAVAQLGCAARATSPPVLAPSARESLGTVAVVRPEAPPRVRVFREHSAGRGAGRGAAAGAQAGRPFLEMGKVPLLPFVVVGLGGLGLSLGGALIGAPVGALVGAVKAPAAAAVKQAEAELTSEASGFDLAACLETRTVEALRGDPSTNSVIAATRRPAASPEDPGRHRSLADEGVDTVLELGTPALDVSGPFGQHPDGALVLTVPVRLTRAGDGAVLLAHDARHVELGAGFADWPADAGRFREALDGACAGATAWIMRLLGSPPAP